MLTYELRLLWLLILATKARRHEAPEFVRAIPYTDLSMYYFETSFIEEKLRA